MVTRLFGTIACRRVATIGMLVAVLSLALAAPAARAQALSVLPVIIQMAPGQRAAALTLVNQGSVQSAVQIRTFVWSQPGGHDQLTPSDELLASPPLATIPPGGTQIVRLALRQPPQGHEATYRILIDQIPPPAEPGVVRVTLRLSLPIFAEGETRVAPHLQFHIERDAGQSYLVALNDGSRHETLRDITLTTSDGNKLTTEAHASPYVLAGATRRWRLDAQTPLPARGGTVHLSANADTSTGVVDQAVPIVEGR
jgi:fimbrial chaperone protein